MGHGKKGYAFSEMVTDYVIHVLKDERELVLLKGETRVSTFPNGIIKRGLPKIVGHYRLHHPLFYDAVK